MNKLSIERRAAILGSLTEGVSIASTCRMFGVHKTSVLRLLADAGEFASQLHDLLVRGLQSRFIEVDETWGFVKKKQKNVQSHEWGKGFGDNWLWVAIDNDSKLVVSWTCGGRDTDFTNALMADIRDRVDTEPQFTTDGWRPYHKAIPKAFGENADHAQVVKKFATPKETGPERKYSPPVCISCELKVISGKPNMAKATTSHVERFNLANRTINRRFTRLTLAHSKRLSNHEYSVALTLWAYNWVKVHSTVKTTPAVAAGIAGKPMNWIQFLTLMQEEEDRLGRRITDYIPSPKRDV